MPSSSKPDVISGIRAQCRALVDVCNNLRALKVKSDSIAGFSAFADNNFTGDNAGITAAEYTQAVSDFNTIVNAILSGGSISVGTINNLIKLL